MARREFTPTLLSYKPKTLTSRVGSITFRVPQVRGETDFYPSALEKVSALSGPSRAEMYVRSVSTRKVSALVEELCGTRVSSSQVSECAKLLDSELHKWRQRALGDFPHPASFGVCFAMLPKLIMGAWQTDYTTGRIETSQIS